jgi:hypothetical protein
MKRISRSPRFGAAGNACSAGSSLISILRKQMLNRCRRSFHKQIAPRIGSRSSFLSDNAFFPLTIVYLLAPGDNLELKPVIELSQPPSSRGRIGFSGDGDAQLSINRPGLHVFRKGDEPTMLCWRPTRSRQPEQPSL